MKTQKIKISKVKELLSQGKKVKVKTLNNEFTDITDYVEKGVCSAFLVTLENGNNIKVSGAHRFLSNSGWLETFELIPNETMLLCDTGEYSLVREVRGIGDFPIVDISVADKEQCYFGNGIANHNTGKSYMAAQIAANAQKQGKIVVYFDSESAIDPDFLERAGCNLERLMYIQATSVEFVLETIEELLGASDDQLLFIWDSLAFTPSVSDVEGDFNPQSSMAVKARILAKGLSKLIIPIADKQATFLVLNQLKTNIPSGPNARIIAMTTPYMTPGGKAAHYSYSLRIWLTGRKAKSAFVEDDKGFRIGSEVKAKIEKSRFGTQGRSCAFRILWGTEDVGINDEESWLDAVKGSECLKSAGAWYTLTMPDGYTKKFQPSKWAETIKSDEEFRSKIIQLMDEEVVQKFDKREGNAEDFYADPE